MCVRTGVHRSDAAPLDFTTENRTPYPVAEKTVYRAHFCLGSASDTQELKAGPSMGFKPPALWDGCLAPAFWLSEIQGSVFQLYLQGGGGTSKAAWEGHEEGRRCLLWRFPHLPCKVLLVSPSRSGSIRVTLTPRNGPGNLQGYLSRDSFLKHGLHQLTYLLWV